MNPFVNCKIHGFQKIHWVCEHLIDGVLIGRPQDMHLVETRRYSSWVCKNCKEADQGQLKNCRVACDECVKTSQLKFARDLGLDDPFQAYEKTLTFAEEKTVNELKYSLQSLFGFKIEQIHELGISISALQIKYGAISYPLTIKIYGIREEALQSRILESIDDFFQRKEKYQRLVLFYEKEYWEEDNEGEYRKRIIEKDNPLLRREIKC